MYRTRKAFDFRVGCNYYTVEVILRCRSLNTRNRVLNFSELAELIDVIKKWKWSPEVQPTLEELSFKIWVHFKNTIDALNRKWDKAFSYQGRRPAPHWVMLERTRINQAYEREWAEYDSTTS